MPGASSSTRDTGTLQFSYHETGCEIGGRERTLASAQATHGPEYEQSTRSRLHMRVPPGRLYWVAVGISLVREMRYNTRTILTHNTGSPQRPRKVGLAGLLVQLARALPDRLTDNSLHGYPI